jgi:hypothetical protein
MSKIVQKHIINSTNSLYFKTIIGLLKANAFMNHSMEQLISTHQIYGKKVDFYLSFIKTPGTNFSYKVGAFYFPKQVNRKYKILITINISDSFRTKQFSEVHFRIKACLVHEIEHHLQNRKAPTREKLPRKNYKGILEYINAPSEQEAILKHLYFLHKKTGISFTKLLIEEADIVSDNEDIQDIFIRNMTKYLINRKDLNLLKRITF